MQNPLEARSALAVQRAQAQELPDAVLLAEVERRGWNVKRTPNYLPFCPCESCKRVRGELPFSWERDARGE